ncbi:hypothetical protein VPH35_006044 [Triticum aestivum]|uniref:pterocarpan synthase 1-like n=1 Tax=Triticum aestivum TaxID=4565 RepID=UPI00194A9005|nr:pterocarpan synthase 1-like [Triticum aestivum]
MADPRLALASLFVSILMLSIAHPFFACPTHCESEIKMQMYLHQVVSGPTHNQEVVFKSTPPIEFGRTVAFDYTLLDAPAPDAKIIGRAKGTHVQADQVNAGDFSHFSMIFQQGRFTGSTFQVMGMTPPNGVWAIVGGTNELAMAQGIIQFAIVKGTPNVESYRELNITAFIPTVSIATGSFVQYFDI